MRDNIKIHPTAEVSEKSEIGSGTMIWNQVQVRENTKIGTKCILSKDVYIDTGVSIGNNVKIQNGVSVYNGVTIEDDVFVGPHVAFTNDLYPRATNQNWKITKTLIKKGSSIGANATIVCGTTINDYSMIGSGSVINKDVPKYGLVVGNPSRLIGFVCECGLRLKELSIEDNHVKMICDTCNKEFNINKEDYSKIK
ncbi:MAG: acyltransferase [Candidatus Sericytochromatia bacterium]